MTKAEPEGGGAAGVDWRQEGRMKQHGEERRRGARRMKGGHRGGEVWKSPTSDTRREKQRASFVSSKGDSGGGKGADLGDHRLVQTPPLVAGSAVGICLQ